MASDTDRIVELFKQEIAEVASGGVELKVVARKPGVRAKVAVQGTAENLDCIGTCVGTRGIRMKRIVNALNQDRWDHPAVESTSIEQIDLFEWTQDVALLIRRALMPYRVCELNLNENRTRATVRVIEPESAKRSTGNLADHVELASEICRCEIVVV
jgi:N utilization substance protein A